MLLSVAAFAAPMPDLPAPVEPVLEWTDRDLRRTRTSRAGALVSAVAPGALIVGLVAAGSPVEATSTTGVLLVGAGVSGLLLGPPMLLLGADGSARALQHQGLDASRTYGQVGFLTYGVGGLATLGLAATNHPAEAVTVGTAAYLAEVVLGAQQQRSNHRMRRGAGWVDWRVAPALGSATGVTVAGTFR